MAITCPRCGAGFDVTLFQFGHRVRCDCGEWVDLGRGHTVETGGEDGKRASEPRRTRPRGENEDGNSER